MKPPQSRGTAIDMNRMSNWVTDFCGYRVTINEGRIDRWISQFNANDRDLAARILDCVDFISHDQMTNAFRSIITVLPGWNINETQRQGRWKFVAFTASAGESGDEMLHSFRAAVNMNGRKYDDLFIYKSELVRENLGPNDTVVFIDDFSGTGTQVCNVWPELQELLPGNPRIFLILIAVSNNAYQKIQSETSINIYPRIQLREEDNIFSPNCNHFTSDEKDLILNYCRRADNRNPRGFGECGFVLAFAHTCPNNSIPILHVQHTQWEGLFRRYN